MPDVFPHIPATVREVLDFLTDVRSHPAGEVRDSLRDGMQRLVLGLVRQPAEAARIVARFRDNAAGEWHVPIWQDATFFSGNISAGAGSISVETDADYRAGGKAIIWASDLEWELVDVASASGGTLTLSGTVAASYTGPLLVAPVGTFVSPEGISQARSYPVERFSVDFLRTDNDDLGASSLATHLSSPVLADGSVVVQELEGGVRQALDLIDSGFGAVAIETSETYVRQRSMVSFADSAVAARWSRRQLLHYLRGRDRAFWLPTFRRDFTVLVSFTGTLLRAAEKDWPDVAGLVGRSIEIDNGSSTIHRTITAASIVSNELRLTLNANASITVGTGSRVSLMTLQRLDADRVEIEHRFIGDGFLSTARVPTIEVAA